MFLLASTLWGGVYLLLLFGLCFGGVVGFQYLRLRFQNPAQGRKKEAEDDPAPSPQPPAKKQEQPQKVYYIVEKKRSRSKSSYSKPKEIHFD